MGVEFSRSHKKARELPLTAMIDVVFILIFFFMLTTSFLRIESMELNLPSAAKQEASNAKSVTIILRGEDYIKFGEVAVSMSAARQLLRESIKVDPASNFTVLVDDEVSMQRLVTFMDMISHHGGQSLSVRRLAK